VGDRGGGVADAVLGALGEGGLGVGGAGEDGEEEQGQEDEEAGHAWDWSSLFTFVASGVVFAAGDGAGESGKCQT
jgi:hypothetical protein